MLKIKKYNIINIIFNLKSLILFIIKNLFFNFDVLLSSMIVINNSPKYKLKEYEVIDGLA